MSGTNGAAAPGTGGSEDTGSDDGAPDRAEIEARAKRMGWMPRERYRGDPEHFVDADEFIERGERMLPILQQSNRRQDQTITALQRQIAEQGSTLANLVKATRRAEKVGYDRAMRELQQQRAKAVAEADTAAFNDAEQQIAALGPAPVVEDSPAPNGRDNTAAAGPPAEVTAFIRRNPWFNTSVAAKAFATATLTEVEGEFPDQSLAENLAEVEVRVRQRFPELFPGRRRTRQPEPEEGDDGADEGDGAPPANNRRAAAPLVSPSNAAPARRPGPRSFASLPAEAKREYERQKKMLAGKGEPFSQEEYARYYFEAEGEAA